MIEMPERIARLPTTEKGYPEIFFGAIINGKFDIRVIDVMKFKMCVNGKLCWLCGDPLGWEMTFVVDQPTLESKITYEPPCHYDCAEYALKVCPFITNPHRTYRNGKAGSIGDFELYTTMSYEIGPFKYGWPNSKITMGPRI